MLGLDKCDSSIWYFMQCDLRNNENEKSKNADHICDQTERAPCGESRGGIFLYNDMSTRYKTIFQHSRCLVFSLLSIDGVMALFFTSLALVPRAHLVIYSIYMLAENGADTSLFR